MALRVITTVGTSIFSNYQKREIAEKLDSNYQSINDLVDKLDKLSASEYNVSRWKSPIRNLKERISLIWLPFAIKKSSAEIETLYKIAEEEKQNLAVYLLATDTILSVVACELIKEWFDNNPSVNVGNDKEITIRCHFYGDINAEDTTIAKGLQIQDANLFETQGFENLLKIINKYKEKGNTILNISGGYKAVIPFLTLFAQLEKIPLKCAYEDSGTLITVGNLPFNFDWQFGEFYFDYLTKDGLKTITNYPDVLNMLRSSGLIRKTDYKLTTLGQFFKDYICSLLTDKKTHLGYFMELKFFEYFIKTNRNLQYEIFRSREYWWDLTNKTQYANSPRYDKDRTKEKRIDIDIFLSENNEEVWCEVKSCSQTGLKKAKEQIITMLDFIKETNYSAIKEIRLLLYKPINVDMEQHKRLFDDIRNLFIAQTITFSIQYFELPTNNNNTLNYKALFEKDINLNILN